MITVDLITSWQERCGIAEYALDLTQNVKDVKFVMHGRPFSAHDVFEGDIVHLIHGIYLMRHWLPEDTQRLRDAGKKTLCTYCDTTDIWSGNELSHSFDRVVVHEPTLDESAVVIPHGIPGWKNPGIAPQNKIGTAGFPVEHKGFLELARVAKDLGVGFLAIAPESEHADTHAVMQQVREICPEAEIITDWLHRASVISKLAECAVVAFTHRNPGSHTGISGSVRMGLAAGRPTVTSRSSQFKDLFSYADEIYILPTDNHDDRQLRGVVEQALKPEAKTPKRILEDMSWEHSGQMYKDVYRQLLT